MAIRIGGEDAVTQILTRLVWTMIQTIIFLTLYHLID